MTLPRSNPDVAAPARPAVGYARVSTGNQGESVPDQQRDTEKHAAQNGYEIIKWYVDDAISGTSLDGRRAFKQMQADAEAPGRDWRFILVHDVSRFSRGDSDEAGHLRHQFRQVGVEIIYCNENLTGGDADDLVIGVKQWLARKFVQDLSKVTIRGQVSHSEARSWNGGTPPYGFDLVYSDSSGHPYQVIRWRESGEKEVYDLDGRLTRIVPRGERLVASKQDRAILVPSTPERTATIKRIFHECVELGWGYRTIADGLNKDGMPSPRDGNWSANTHAMWSVGTIRAILKNPAYKGDLVWNRRTFAKFHRVKGGVADARSRVDANKPRENSEADWIVSENTHEPLVSPTLFHRAQELMKSRGNHVGLNHVRSGKGLRSPFLLSGLITCGRCGQNYQGRTINSTKHRKDGSKIKSYYYACGGWVMKGSSACTKHLLRRDPLEELLLDTIQARLLNLLSGEGERLLRQFVDEEIAAQGLDPRREKATLRARLAEIDQTASVVLESASPETRPFIDSKLRELAAEKRRLQERLDELEAIDRPAINADAVVRGGLAALQDLPRMLENANIEARKEFVRAFIGGITIRPESGVLDLQMKTLPSLGDARSTCQRVAGARYVPLQIEMRPLNFYVAGQRRAA
jgi:DNA invertase Pin-like site-specific DNA recombinase